MHLQTQRNKMSYIHFTVGKVHTTHHIGRQRHKRFSSRQSWQKQEVVLFVDVRADSCLPVYDFSASMFYLRRPGDGGDWLYLMEAFFDGRGLGEGLQLLCSALNFAAAHRNHFHFRAPSRQWERVLATTLHPFRLYRSILWQRRLWPMKMWIERPGPIPQLGSASKPRRAETLAL